MRNVIKVAVLGLALALVGCAAPAKALMRVNAGADKDYTDLSGAKWLADKEFAEGAQYGAVGGKTVARAGIEAVPGTKAPQVYLTERYGMKAYQFAVPNGVYTVRLHFAETYEGITKEGARLFSVSVNGKPVLKDLDVFKAAGGFARPLVKDVEHIQVADGKLVIEFAEGVQNPEVNGIEILAE